jgi:hypothetical protein
MIVFSMVSIFFWRVRALLTPHFNRVAARLFFFKYKYRLGRHAKVDTRYNCPLQYIYLPKYLPMKTTTYK